LSAAAEAERAPSSWLADTASIGTSNVPEASPVKLDNRISLQKLEVFCLVVELGSVSRAADRLYITQPVVSAHLHSLQARVGVQLLRREGRGIELTEAGRAVHAWAKDMLRRRDDLSDELGALEQGIAGSVRIGSSMSVGNYLLPPTLIDFRRQYPSAKITLTISAPELALESVLSGRSDFCVVASTGGMEPESLAAEMIGKQRFVLVASATDDTVGDAVSVDALHDLSWVCPPGGLAIRRSQDAALASLGVTRRKVAIELGSAEAMKQAVHAHLGVALLWEASVKDDLASGALREVRIPDRQLLDELYIVKLASKRLTPLQQRMYDALIDVVGGA
jgi:DNA-binding transcriptional LysR family regulator